MSGSENGNGKPAERGVREVDADMRAYAGDLRGFLSHAFKGVHKRFDDVDKRFKDVDKRFDEVDNRFKDVDKRFDDVDRQFKDVDRRFGEVDKRFDTVDRDFGALKTGFRVMDGRMSRIEQRFARFEVGLNDLQRNVRKLVANGRPPHPAKRRKR